MDYTLFHLDVDESLDWILWKRQWLVMDITVSLAPGFSSYSYKSNFSETLGESTVQSPPVGDGSVQIQLLKGIRIHDRYTNIEWSVHQANVRVSVRQTEHWRY